MLFIPLLAIVTSIASAKNESKNLPELIVPVDTAVAREIISNMGFNHKKNLYFTKRFRIVMIDKSLLDGSVDAFVITPFPGKLSSQKPIV